VDTLTDNGPICSLSEHTVNKHNKTVAECFPGVEIKP
jgi:hypothetical protein